MSFSQQSLSSFTPYQDPKSPNRCGSSFDFHQFSRLNLNSSHENDSSGNQSYRSNASLTLKQDGSKKLSLQEKNHYDMLSMRSRNRKKSIEIGIRPSQPGNLTFLKHSLFGKSQLNHHEDFNFQEIDELQGISKQLSQRSCPVRNQELVLQKKKSHQQVYEYNDDFSGPIDRTKLSKKFKKTKNYLRTLSNYLHKYIKYNKKVREFVMNYYMRNNKAMSSAEEEEDELELEAKEFYSQFLEWVGSLNMTNFTQYQKVWATENKFLSIYRQLSYLYYIQQSFCDIQHSRLTSKQILLSYIPQFIEGLLNPKQFTHFKNQ